MTSPAVAVKAPGEAKHYEGSSLKIAIVHARWNRTIISALLSGAISSLLRSGVLPSNIFVHDVPGSFELPLAVQKVTQKGAGERPDAIIAIGVLIKGESMHFEYISEAVTQGLMRVQLDTGTPVVFGVLTALSEEQALARAGLGVHGEGEGQGHNHGKDWGDAAVELATGGRYGVRYGE